ncbi:unnamed protein product [Mytilus edulis]|uniref:Endonuclease/exonuclease/phosphatase domain-containing protein n=1 Tax=Mytilus edulis TaxID=6550 RepID=A0A8S3V3W1_MYTED|nr:unnamed protein product [Mytilus edulis]
MSKLNIGFWNTHGLNSHKIEDVDFVTYVNSFEIVGFVETLVSDSPGNLPDFSMPFTVKPIKRKRKGRASGGIAVYCKPHIRKGVKEMKRSKFSLWLKLDKQILGLSYTVYLCFCYIKPYLNKDDSELIFTQLQNEIMQFKHQGEILICGDFNARTGGLQDYIQNDDENENFIDCPVPINYSPDIPLVRRQMDREKNIHGTLLVSLCKDLQLRLLNGRFLGDSLGFFTFYNSNGQSTVDYMLTTPNLFYCVQHFIVRSPVELSDHCLLSVCFKSCTQRETTLESHSDVGKFQWEHSMSDNYHDALLHKESVNDILDLMNNIDDENCDDIDFLVSSVNKIYVNAASQTLVLKKKSSRPSNKRKRAKPKKAWMSNDCLLLRKEVRSLGKRLQKDKNNANLRQTYSNCVKHYNKQKKSLKAEFYRTFISKLNSLEHKDSKSFWKSINDLKNNHQQAPSPLSKQEWVEHYKSLLNSDSELNFPDDLETSKDNHCSLDYPFTCNEVKKGITRLKSETPNGLQHCVDALQSFCIDWGLNVNTKKTQTMILSNSKNRSLLDKHYFYFGPQPLESATEYKYLGIVFNNRGKLNIAAENLADKARKAYFALKSKLPYSNCIAVEKWVRLFNSLISPIMTYGSEIWISDFNINLDTADKTTI